MGEDEYAPITKKEKVNQLDHVHNIGPLVTRKGRKRKEFIDNRHDLCFFSIIVRKYFPNCVFLPYKKDFGFNIKDIKQNRRPEWINYPFLATRLRGARYSII